MKDAIKREDLRQNIMKEAIFRIDYQGIINLEGILDDFNKAFPNHFKLYETTFHSRIELGAIKIDEISETLSVPIRELEKQPIHRYSENLFGSDKLTLDISKYYTYLHVECKEYKTIDTYLEFFSNLIIFLKSKFTYLSIRRFGLRKVGENVYYNPEAIYEDFEREYFHAQFSPKYRKQRCEYFDLLTIQEDPTIINYKRLIEKGYAPSADGVAEAFRVVLDIDGYLGEEFLTKFDISNAGNTRDLLSNINNAILFDIFKMSVTQAFLERNKS